MDIWGPVDITNILPEERYISDSDPIEDYFTLVTSSVKLNSPYIDAICTIQTKDLYQMALEQNVPFHKWHYWVENKLT